MSEQEAAVERQWERERGAEVRLDVDRTTLFRWRKKGVIESRVKGGIRYYNVGKFLEELEKDDDDENE